MGRKGSLPDDAPAPRLCQLIKWPHFQGYGFNLHTEKGRTGQFVGKVDAKSPAEACGLLEGDLIVEVNGINIGNENHKQVVERIKSNPNQVTLLVVDATAAEYYRKNNIVVKNSLPNVKHLKSSSAEPGLDRETGESETSSQQQLSIEECLTFAAQGTGEDLPPPVPPKLDLTETAGDDSRSESASSGHDPPDNKKSPETEQKQTDGKASEESKNTAEVSQEKETASSGKDESPSVDTSPQVTDNVSSERAQPSPAPSAESTGTAESGRSGEPAPPGGDPLNLNMSAAEMREYLRSKKRPDPRKENLTFKQRHQIVSNM